MTVSTRTAVVSLVVLSAGAALAAPLVAAWHPRTLLPIVGAAALVLAWSFRAPRAVDLFEPVTFLTWTHYAPAYVVGTFLLAIGAVAYPYGGLVADPVASCTLAMLYTFIGYLALRVGAGWEGAHAVGHRLAARLPAPPAAGPPMSGILALIGLGMAANYGAFRAGVIGFAVPGVAGPFDAAVSYAGALLSLGHFLFWHRWFDPAQPRLPRTFLIVPAVLVLYSMTLSGNRGALLAAYLVAALAFRFTRGRLTLRQNVVVVILAFVALAVGMVYGSLFRVLKGGETTAPAVIEDTTAPPSDPSSRRALTPPLGRTAPRTTAPDASPARPAAPQRPRVGVTRAEPPPAARQSLGRQVSVAAETVGVLLTDPRTARFGTILAGAGQRLNLVSDVSVTVARYPALRPLEAEYGISDLWTTTWTGFVPRALWPGKPRVSDARAYAALYFGWDGNSFASTPPIDLLRNAGPLAIAPGMALLGLVLGVLGVALTAPSGTVSAERVALFSILLVSTNLEGMYGLLLPGAVRVGAVVLAGLLLLRVWPGRTRAGVSVRALAATALRQNDRP